VIKTICKIGNSQGILFQVALLELAHLKRGDEVSVEVHEGGTITQTPIRTGPSQAKVSRFIKSTMKDSSRTMKKLACAAFREIFWVLLPVPLTGREPRDARENCCQTRLGF
jgi:antitoxin component of MazEF toxin-antitoxin module